uniref:Uncharacterized protein n=1 Tax=Caenorhabditis japonica TaxID=281687 RepID=A0A8R1IZF6_CAEJA
MMKQPCPTVSVIITVDAEANKKINIFHGQNEIVITIQITVRNSIKTRAFLLRTTQNYRKQLMEKSSGFRSGHDTGHLFFFMNAGKWALHQSWVYFSV